jgi:hypothetical protein
MMPDESQDHAQNPAILKIKQCLDEMTELGKKKDDIMQEGLNLSSNFNTSEQLMEVYF